MAVWDFCPSGMVPVTVPPEQQQQSIQFNGWTFSSKPNVPYQKGFKIMMHGLRWFLQTNGLYDNTTSPTVNARRFEEFVQTHGTWKAFTFPHPHFGNLECRFKALPTVPPGIENSDGLIEPFEVELIHHNPGY